MGSDDNSSIYGAGKFIKLLAFISLVPLFEIVIQIIIGITFVSYNPIFLRIYSYLPLFWIIWYKCDSNYVGGYVYAIFRLNKFVNSSILMSIAILEIVLLVAYDISVFWFYQILLNYQFYDNPSSLTYILFAIYRIASLFVRPALYIILAFLLRILHRSFMFNGIPNSNSLSAVGFLQFAYRIWLYRFFRAFSAI